MSDPFFYTKLTRLLLTLLTTPRVTPIADGQGLYLVVSFVFVSFEEVS